LCGSTRRSRDIERIYYGPLIVRSAIAWDSSRVDATRIWNIVRDGVLVRLARDGADVTVELDALGTRVRVQLVDCTNVEYITDDADREADDPWLRDLDAIVARAT
jgi:hypothetical protein